VNGPITRHPGSARWSSRTQDLLHGNTRVANVPSVISDFVAALPLPLKMPASVATIRRVPADHRALLPQPQGSTPTASHAGGREFEAESLVAGRGGAPARHQSLFDAAFTRAGPGSRGHTARRGAWEVAEHPASAYRCDSTLRVGSASPKIQERANHSPLNR
jgi:hypothetical protein